MNLVMFDIDGTLLKSYEFDTLCFERAVWDVLNISVDNDWSKYTHVTDSGILDEIITTHCIKGKRDFIHDQVKRKFIEYLSEYLSSNTVQQIEGASAFLTLLKSRNDIVLSIATGGWEETAKLKLKSAGIDCSGIAIASSSDHFERTEIMIVAESKLRDAFFTSKSYFGDASWDKKAAEKLVYNFIFVGSRIEHHQKIKDYTNVNEVLSCIGL